jgi:hypothetical protein
LVNHLLTAFDRIFQGNYVFFAWFVSFKCCIKRPGQLLTGWILQADIAAVLLQTVDAVHLLNHVEGVDFDQLLTVHRQLKVGTGHGNFRLGVFALFPSPLSISF